MLKTGTRSTNSFLRRRPPKTILVTYGETVRTILLRPRLVISLGAIGLTFLTLYLGATGYLLFRDDFLAATIARQSQMQDAYEERIASLRADIERLTSRQLLDQKAFDKKLAMLQTRQSALDVRQDLIAGLSQAVRRAGVAPVVGSETDATKNQEVSSDSDAGEPIVSSSVGPLGAGQRALAAIALLKPTLVGGPPVPAPVARITTLEGSLDALAHSQVAFVKQVADDIGLRADRILSTLKELGHSHKLPIISDGAHDVGGPFVPITASADPETFRIGIAIVLAEIERLSLVRNHASQLPLAKPVAKAIVTSKFGRRLDPFFKRPAMHTGTDFRAAEGRPVRSTANGKIVVAEYGDGYGNLVEIDHGNGFTTRYGHLSRIGVKVGDVIAEGEIIGGVGSTGRSTGPHLHYEVRVDGKPVNPMRFIKAGGKILRFL